MQDAVRGNIRHNQINRAREQISSEQEPLMRAANKMTQKRSYAEPDSKDSIRAWIMTIFLSLAAYTVYVMMLLMFYYLYYSSLAATCIVYVALILLGLGMLYVGIEAGKHQMTTMSPWALWINRGWLVWLGFSCMLMATIGGLVGFFVYYQDLVYYERYQELETYTNVGASQSTVEYNDAGAILFTDDTRLDTMRAVGFQSRWNGNIYCVAPIVDGSMGTTTEINWWAVGLDCCNPRQDFRCDDAQDSGNKAATIVLNPDDVVRPYMEWAVEVNPYPRYESAIQLENANYFTQAAQSYRLVYWTNDPYAKQATFKQRAVTKTIVVSVLVFCLLFGFCYVASFFYLFPVKRATKGFPFRY